MSVLRVIKAKVMKNDKGREGDLEIGKMGQRRLCMATYINLPFFQLTFFFNPDWSTYVCGADEIRDYQKSIVNNFGLQGHISFNTGVRKATWDEIYSKWTIETDTNETFQVTHLISGCGVLRTPNIPNFKGPENSIHFFEYVL